MSLLRSMASQKQSRLIAVERGQGLAEYAVMLAVILIVLVGVVRLVGVNASRIFSQVASATGAHGSERTGTPPGHDGE